MDLQRKTQMHGRREACAKGLHQDYESRKVTSLTYLNVTCRREQDCGRLRFCLSSEKYAHLADQIWIESRSQTGGALYAQLGPTYHYKKMLAELTGMHCAGTGTKFELPRTPYAHTGIGGAFW